MKKSKFKIWETALLIAVSITLCQGLIAKAQQEELSQGLIRLHILANSDESKDQEVKLKVRDAVLNYLEPRLENASTKDEAYTILENELQNLENISVDECCDNNLPMDALATLCLESYPVRHYENFDLPAGEYISLQIKLGEAKGHNWWCVVFPPLCTNAAAEEIEVFSKETQDLIVEGEEKYVFKFKILEWFESIREFFD